MKRNGARIRMQTWVWTEEEGWEPMMSVLDMLNPRHFRDI